MIKTLLSLFLLASFAFAEDVSMNDIRLLQYGDFTQTWKLVTVRYRQDSNEMRFAYANPIAWDAMQAGTSVYPDGSVFAKVGFRSGVDPAFNSSLVPSGARRFQFMVKDQKKYAETDGWGYAVFQSNGDLFEGDVKTVTLACHACHRLVTERNFIFSEAVEVSPTFKNLRIAYDIEKNKSHIFYTTLNKKVFANNLKKFIKKINEKSLDVLQGEMRKYFFGGTLDELTPLLIKRVLETKKASGFVSDDQKTFKILKLSKNKNVCSPAETAIEVFEFRAEWKADQDIVVKKICYPKNNI